MRARCGPSGGVGGIHWHAGSTTSRGSLPTLDRFTVVLTVALLFAGSMPAALAQTGQQMYLNGPPDGLFGGCANAGCHATTPSNDVLVDGIPRVLRLVQPGIPADPDYRASLLRNRAQLIFGMRDVVQSFDPQTGGDMQLKAVIAYLETFVAAPAPGSPPVCTILASESAPSVGTSITLTATCSGSPTSYSWTGCANTDSTCTKTETTAGARTYSVTASNAAGASAPASVSINWQATSGPPTPTPVPPPPTSQVVEYYHAAFGHYFITNIDAEITAIDGGMLTGWARTGRTFKAYSSNNGYVAAVCRFFTDAFPPKSSHFFTSNSAECNHVYSNNKDWTFEAQAFYVQPADAVSGSCPTGFKAVYRLYNNGQGGAPNHRYTTDPAVRAEMMGMGWIPEGFGAAGVGFCAPN